MPIKLTPQRRSLSKARFTERKVKRESRASLCGGLVIDPCGCHANPCACFRMDAQGCYQDCPGERPSSRPGRKSIVSSTTAKSCDGNACDRGCGAPAVPRAGPDLERLNTTGLTKSGERPSSPYPGGNDRTSPKALHSTDTATSPISGRLPQPIVTAGRMRIPIAVSVNPPYGWRDHYGSSATTRNPYP